jgi:RimJ/RimL family protein N-acetyltransferase
MTTPVLQAPGIVLRPLERADAPGLFVAHGDPDMQKYRLSAAHKDVAETERYIDHTLERGRAWAITEDGGEALGRIALREIRDGVGEFGVILRRDAHGRGLASKAVRLVRDYAFAELGMHRLAAAIDAENSASISLFLRAGFRREALLRRNWRTHLGVRDTVVMGLLREPQP